MLKRFHNLFKQDLAIALRNGFHYVVLILALLCIVLVNFAIPGEAKTTPREIFLDATPDKVLEVFLREQGVEAERFYSDRETLEAELKGNRNTIGIIFTGNLGNPRVTVIHQGTESQRILNVLESTIEGALEMAGAAPPREAAFDVELLRREAPPVPFNKGMLPLFMVLEVIMFGFVIIAVMVFQEKEEGSIRAFRVSPAGVLEYILSKASVNVLMGLVYGLLIVIFTMGFNVNFLNLLVLIILASFLMTLAGLFLSVFFNNISEFIFVALGVVLLTMLPAISYMYPSFAPAFVTWIPSYPVVFGMREIIFPTGKAGFMAPLVQVLLVENALLLGLSYWAVQRKMMKEGR